MLTGFSSSWMEMFRFMQRLTHHPGGAGAFIWRLLQRGPMVLAMARFRTRSLSASGTQIYPWQLNPSLLWQIAWFQHLLKTPPPEGVMAGREVKGGGGDGGMEMGVRGVRWMDVRKSSRYEFPFQRRCIYEQRSHSTMFGGVASLRCEDGDDAVSLR